ncbi:Anaphase-promoting complex (APC), subunit 11 [Handroanthus impetiginosus]|uniref:RING-type E3 ubiquitin transferase n=1 Tax=Handroanthus impetiginosus TaxID=429701 RepID=A0A2G9H8D2_9LAMI|nr:Anaphase-promoting complex (APC), subunit 11 [Handroanthus impetiginosus]
MASETSSSEQSFMERLINSRNRDISLFFPFILGLNSISPLQETENQETPDRIVLINPFTQGMVVIERSRSNNSNSSSLRFDSFLNDLFSGKSGCPPASKASIDAMESVEIVRGENDDEQCVICLEEWESGEKAKEMPCKHRFHGECIEKWLKIHGSCPVCRYEMPVDENDDEKKRNVGEIEGERRREIWVSFTFGSGGRSGENDQAASSESSETSDSLLSHHQEMQE